MKRTAKAIGMLSGGLDSTLALALLKKQGVEVKAVNFYTGFCITETQRRQGGRRDGTIPRNDALFAAANLEVDIEYVDVSESGYLDMIVAPKYGYGKNANPCVDCRIFMMAEARKVMEREGADFIFTGEVLGQRPKSQRRDTLRTVERESGLDGRLLRPLSAKLLEPTLAEKDGLVDRERLLDISGRSRQRQMQLARELGIEGWPQPAGGCCYLADENFASKFFDILDNRPVRKIAKDDILLLATGRHFRISPRTKLIVGRAEGENFVLERFAEGRAKLAAVGVNGPVALVEGEPTWEERVLCASIVARYGKGKDEPSVVVEWSEDGELETYSVAPLKDEAKLEEFRL
jgi:tRNA U34 2-thiouridine synthase MnmA/TrmU